MSKAIIVSIVSLFIGVVTTLLVIYSMEFYKIRSTVISDHVTLTEVVNFLNTAINQNQPNNQISAPTPTPSTTKTK